MGLLKLVSKYTKFFKRIKELEGVLAESLEKRLQSIFHACKFARILEYGHVIDEIETCIYFEWNLLPLATRLKVIMNALPLRVTFL